MTLIDRFRSILITHCDALQMSGKTPFGKKEVDVPEDYAVGKVGAGLTSHGQQVSSQFVLVIEPAFLLNEPGLVKWTLSCFSSDVSMKVWQWRMYVD